MLRLFAITLLVAIAAPVSRADDSRAQDRGQAVSECNHRVNERDLKGQDRKDFVGGCLSRQAMNDDRMNDDRRDRYRECHARAAARGLHDASRRQYIEDCVADRLERRTLVMLGG
jgi:hypothetical protein